MERPPVIFDANVDPDAATDVPRIVMLPSGPALHSDDLRLSVGSRKGGGEDLLVTMASPSGLTLFSPLTPVTARALADGLNDWAGEQESKAKASASSALAKAGGRS